jgi:hypothetical protein
MGHPEGGQRPGPGLRKGLYQGSFDFERNDARARRGRKGFTQRREAAEVREKEIFSLWKQEISRLKSLAL